MSSLRRRPRSPAAAKTPLEDDDLLSEILLRLPPRPSSLPRASLVCTRWRGLVSDPGFFCRFRRHHHRRSRPPLLGYFARDDASSFVPTLDAPDRVPPGRFSLPRGDGDGDGDRFLTLGCRHGLVLLFDVTPSQMLVWDPVTGEQRRLDMPPGIATYAERTAVNGAVLRDAAADAGGGAHFQVVLTVADNDDKQRRRALACVYSSEAGLWGDLISAPIPPGVPRRDDHHFTALDIAGLPTLVNTGKPAVLAGNCLYWMLAGNFIGILEFDLEKQSLAVIPVPVQLQNSQFWIMRAEGGGGGLGLLFLTGSSIQLWKRNTDCHGVASWALGRTIQLGKLLSLDSQQVSAVILGFAEENNVVFLWTCGILFMIHLESLQFKKLCQTNLLSRYHPFESVYTAGIGDEQPAVGEAGQGEARVEQKE